MNIAETELYPLHFYTREHLRLVEGDVCPWEPPRIDELEFPPQSKVRTTAGMSYTLNGVP
jgi:hypothetical protein